MIILDEIDSWDKESSDGPDCFYTYIDATRKVELSFGNFDSEVDEGFSVGENEGISWQRDSQASPTPICFGAADASYNDQIHHIKATIPNDFFKDGELYLEFFALLTGGLDDESAGVDNIKITAHYDCGCVDEIIVFNDDFENGLTTGWVGGIINNSTTNLFLEQIVNESEAKKTFAVPASNAMTLEFNFYEVGVWSATNELEVSISGNKLDLGNFKSNSDEGRVTGTTTPDGISWERISYNGGNAHKVTANIPKMLYQNRNMILLGFQVTSTDSSNQAAAGIDDVKLTAHFDCKVARCVELDFERKQDGTKLVAGVYVQNEWLSSYGLMIDTAGGYSPSSKARIFDTGNPGINPFDNDPDLGSPNANCPNSGPGIGAGGAPGSKGANCDPLGNVLIIQETNKGTPDDNSAGGTLSFSFQQGKPVKVEHIGLLDMDRNNFDHLEVYTWADEHTIINFQGEGANSVIQVPVNIENVKKLDVYFVGSGAVSEIGFCLEEATSPLACSVFEHRFESQCNIGYFDVDNIKVIQSSDTATITFALEHSFNSSLSHVEVWMSNPNTAASPHTCWAGNDITPGVVFGNGQFEAQCVDGWATVSIAAGNDNGSYKLVQSIDVVQPFCQDGVTILDFDPFKRCYWEFQIPCNPSCHKNRGLAETNEDTLASPEQEEMDCATLSKTVDLYRIPVDHCVSTMEENPIKILSQDSDTITFTVTHDCNSEWIATDFIGSRNELVCHRTHDCGISKQYTAMCIDGATIVDLYTHGNTYGQADGLQLVIPKDCDESGSGSSLCHFRYVLMCKPSKCRKAITREGNRQSAPATLSSLFKLATAAFGLAL